MPVRLYACVSTALSKFSHTVCASVYLRVFSACAHTSSRIYLPVYQTLFFLFPFAYSPHACARALSFLLLSILGNHLIFISSPPVSTSIMERYYTFTYVHTYIYREASTRRCRRVPFGCGGGVPFVIAHQTDARFRSFSLSLTLVLLLFSVSLALFGKNRECSGAWQPARAIATETERVKSERERERVCGPTHVVVCLGRRSCLFTLYRIACVCTRVCIHTHATYIRTYVGVSMYVYTYALGG